MRLFVYLGAVCVAIGLVGLLWMMWEEFRDHGH